MHYLKKSAIVDDPLSTDIGRKRELRSCRSVPHLLFHMLNGPVRSDFRAIAIFPMPDQAHVCLLYVKLKTNAPLAP